MDPDALFDALAAEPVARAVRAQGMLTDRRAVLWKSALLLATTVAFIPVLLLKTANAGAIYLTALVVVHVLGLAVLLYKAPKGTWTLRDPTVWARIAALIVLMLLLGWVGKGLSTATGFAFWASLGGIWALHTVGVIILHLRGRDAACPFLPTRNTT